MAKPIDKSTVRPVIDREIARQVQSILEKKHGKAMSISGACEYALHYMLMQENQKQKSNG